MDSEGKPRILVIEDNGRIRRLVVKVLEFAGYVADQAADGEKGMRLARQRSHELVVLDLALPSQDGWSVLDEMKSDPALRETPVLIFTAFADQSERQRATARGAAGFITKPVGAVELNNAIRGILAGKVI